MTTPLGLCTSPTTYTTPARDTTTVSPGKTSMLLCADSAGSLDSSYLRGDSGMIAVSDAYDLPGFSTCAPRQRQHIKQPARAQKRVHTRLQHFAHHGDALGGIFLDKDRNLGLGEKAARHQFFRNQVLRLLWSVRPGARNR